LAKNPIKHIYSEHRGFCRSINKQIGENFLLIEAAHAQKEGCRKEIQILKDELGKLTTPAQGG